MLEITGILLGRIRILFRITELRSGKTSNQVVDLTYVVATLNFFFVSVNNYVYVGRSINRCFYVIV